MPQTPRSPISSSRRRIIGGAVLSLAAHRAIAQTPVPDILRLVVPFPAGGALDGSARIFADSYQRVTGRRCIVDNKPGAATTIAASEVSRARPDGSVLLWTTGGHLTNGVLMKRLPYDPIAGFTPVTMAYDTYGFALLHRANGPFHSVADVIAAAKKAPGKYSYGSAGNGNTTHVVGALFARSAGIDLIHVPYKGTPLTDVMSGVVDLTFIAPSSVMQYIETKRLKALAISGARRADTLPDVPTFSELGMPEIDIPAWLGFLAPPKMAPDVLAALHSNIARTLADPAFKERMTSLGNRVGNMTPPQFKSYLEQEFARYKRILPPLGIEMDL